MSYKIAHLTLDFAGEGSGPCLDNADSYQKTIGLPESTATLWCFSSVCGMDDI